METLTVPSSLRSRLGHDASEGVVEMFTAYQQLTAARYDQRLTQETTALQIDLQRGLAAVREEIANMRADMFKWSLLFWVGQFAAVVGALSFMLNRH